MAEALNMTAVLGFAVHCGEDMSSQTIDFVDFVSYVFVNRPAKLLFRPAVLPCDAVDCLVTHRESPGVFGTLFPGRGRRVRRTLGRAAIRGRAPGPL